MRKMVFVLSILLFASIANAQTVARTAEWDQPGQDAAGAQALATTLTIDALTPIPLTPTCTTTAGVTHCSAPFTMPESITSGSHAYKLTVANGFGAASSTITGAPPLSPTGFTLKFSFSIPD